MDRIRAAVRKWLGIDDVIVSMSDIPSLTMFKAMEQKQRERHEELMGAMNRLTLILQNAHAFDKPVFNAPVLDWEQAQLIHLHQLESTPPPKEYQDV